MDVKTVCVIGAGAAGLAAIRHIKDDPFLEGCVFEQTNSVGGVWNYTDKVGNDEYGVPVHSTMYKTLRTNIPKEIMGYLDFPFPDSERSYIGHDEVQSYLTKFTDKHDLIGLINFTTRVINVIPNFDNGVLQYPKWQVKTEDLKSKLVSEHYFDAVLICNGHYTKPFYPEIENLSDFQGQIVHSRNYRKPEIFTGKRVVVFGGGPSAIDISIELAEYASQIVLSSKKLSSVMPKQVITKPKIVTAKTHALIASTGEEIQCDVLLLCTGYSFDFPFLSANCGVTVEKSKYISPLYRHLVNANIPTMAFIGIPITVCPFPLFDGQVQYMLKVFKREVQLPTKEEMLNEIREEEKSRAEKSIPTNHSHKFAELQWNYNEILGKDAGFFHLIQPVIKKIYDRCGVRRSSNPATFRHDKITKVDCEHFEYIEDAYPS